MQFKFLVPALLLCCMSLCGQWFGGGVKGGLGHNAADAWARGEAGESIRHTMGLFVEVRLPIGLAVEADALRRPATYIYTSGAPGLALREGRAEGTAWEYPVLFKARIGPWRWKPFAAAGPTFLRFDTLSGSQSCSGPACGVGLGPVSVDFPGRTERGFSMGGGLERRWGIVRLSVEGRHSRFAPGVGIVRSGQTLVLLGLGF
ncbi:MAG: hypothetical protein M9913_08330 [Bryobacteraceae bacterium]|nr:hypothetical protein [Bryobacteraceae bacterium]